MALNPSGGPSMNCTTCTALVTVDNSADTATYNAEYYSLGQASKFVKPGAVRIGSNTFGSGNIEDVAFQNPDGSTALVVLNSNTSSSSTFGVTRTASTSTTRCPPARSRPSPGPRRARRRRSINPADWYEVKNTNSGLCVQPTGGGTANGTALDQEPCTGAANQLWQFQTGTGGAYQVANKNAPSEVWDVTGGTGATGNGTAIQIWSATGASNQQWAAVPLSDGDYEFTAQNSGTNAWTSPTSPPRQAAGSSNGPAPPPIPRSPSNSPRADTRLSS
jgi:glucosylceramidase